MPPLLRRLGAACLTASVLALTLGCDDTSPSPSTSAEDRPLSTAQLVPDDGTWFGVSIDWGHETLADYADRLGHRPAVAVTFSDFPLTDQGREWLAGAADQAHQSGSMLLVTLEPQAGLDAVTTDRAADLARLLDGFNRRGVPVVVRFAHEMNGSWYAWGQQPAAYVAAFRRVATAVHDGAPGSAMMWAPNYGGGYPFSGGRYESAPGSAAARALDTTGDRKVTHADDPYAPYWPGRDFVDWVGMSVYHWGDRYPWGENEVPEPGKFTALLRGTYDGKGGDESAVPDFYATYGEDQGLPVAVTETAALYAPGAGGADELAVKQAWWQQVFADHGSMPLLKMINWFEWRKREPEVGGVVDWRATGDGRVTRAFTGDLPAWLRYGPVQPDR